MKQENKTFGRDWQRNNRISGEPLSPLLPCLGFEEGLLINVDGSFGVGWRCQFPYLITLSEQRRQSVFDTIKNAVNVQTADYDVQVIFDQHAQVDALIGRLDGKADGLQPILSDYTDEQVRQLRERFAGGALRWMEGYVVLVRRNTVTQNRPRETKKKTSSNLFAAAANLFSSAAAEVAYTEEEWGKLKSEFFNYADSLHSALETGGFCPRVLNPDGVLELLYRYWNAAEYDRGGRPRRFHPSENLGLADYFLSNGIGWNRTSGRLTIGDRFFYVAVMRTPPERVQFPQFAPVLLHGGLIKTRYVLTLRQADLAKRKTLVRDRMRELEALAKKSPEFSDDFAEAVRELKELNSGMEKAWLAQQVFIIGGDSTEELEKNLLTLKKAAEQSSGMIVEVERHAAIDYLIAAQPFWTRDRDHYRQIPYNGSQLLTQLPLFGQPGHFSLADGSPARLGAVYETTANTLVNFFPHEDRRFNNANTMILGAAGSGKGMTVNDLITQMRSRHPARFVVIDIGGSYRKTSEALCPGSYFDMSLKNAGRVINPFFVADLRFPDADEIDGMIRFLEKILVGQDEKRLPPEELNLLEQTLIQLFRSAQGRREVTLGEFRDLLQEDTRADKLAQRLGRWTGSGSFANLFDGPNQLDTGNWLTVFDLTSIKDNKQVCPVLFAVIFSVVAQLASRFPKDYKFVVFDECADFLRDPLVAAYIETCYRQMRKFGVSVVGISQTLEEWLSTSSRAGFVSNTTHLILLRQDSHEAATLVRDAFNLSEAEFAILTRLQSIPGEFSQALLWQKSGEGLSHSNVIVKRPTPLGYAMGTTNPRDKAAFQELREKGLGYDQALREFASLFPNGVARSNAAKKITE